MLPPDLSSMDTFVPADALLLCCAAMNSTGVFAVRALHMRHDPEHHTCAPLHFATGCVTLRSPLLHAAAGCDFAGA